MTKSSRRRFLSCGAVLLCFISSGCATQTIAQSETLDDYLKKTFTSIPGAAVSVTHDGAIVFEGGYGYADAERKTPIDVNTRFELASVTKQITAMAVMMEKEAGKFQYDSLVTAFFPEFQSFAQGATIRNLLQHTAGFPDYSELCRSGPARNDDIVTLMAKKGKLDFEPGSRHVYSNTGYDLLAVLVEKTSGLSYPDYLEQKLFVPLGMKDTFVNRWGIPPKTNLARSYNNNSSTPAESPEIVNCNTIYGDGSVFSTAHDMALWNLYLEKNTVVGTTASMDEAYQPVKIANGNTFPYGFGWQLNTASGMKRYSHGGSWAGYRTLNARFPEKQFAVAVLTNAPRGDLEAVVMKAIDTYMH